MTSDKIRPKDHITDDRFTKIMKSYGKLTNPIILNDLEHNMYEILNFRDISVNIPVACSTVYCKGINEIDLQKR